MSPRRTDAKQSPLLEPAAARTNGGAAGKSVPVGVDAPNYNRAVKLDVVNFDSADRPEACLEVDFPIGPINILAQLEINSKKPIYEMGKWWARRQSSVFRAMLIAAATKAPDSIEVADQAVWEVYYANHQKAGNFAGIRVLDPFMGGGTTLVEGARLGFDVAGVDLNPIAWFVTKTAMLDVEPEAVQALFDDIEMTVRPQVVPYTTTSCPRAHVGRWYKTNDVNCPFDLTKARDIYQLLLQPETFDILEVPEGERAYYRYDGPEVIYTFWTKHGPCSRCEHRTPVMRTPVIATKELAVQAVRVRRPIGDPGGAVGAEGGDGGDAGRPGLAVQGRRDPIELWYATWTSLVPRRGRSLPLSWSCRSTRSSPCTRRCRAGAWGRRAHLAGDARSL